MDIESLFDEGIARARDCSFKSQRDEDLYADAFVEGALWMIEKMNSKGKGYKFDGFINNN